MFHEFPRLVAPYTAYAYFWFRLPYAWPGFVTFVVGYVLAGLFAYAAVARRARRQAAFGFALTALGFGTLGALLALRAVVLDTAWLLRVHAVAYAPVLLAAPGAFTLVTSFSPRGPAMRGLLGLLWATTLVGLAGLAVGRVFPGDGTSFSFGFYPRASGWLVPWLTAVVTLAPVYVVMLGRAWRRGTLTSRPLMVGLGLLPLFVLSHGPLLFGVPVFPPTSLAFAPLLLVAWGLAGTQGVGLHTLLFEKGGLFHVLSAILCFTFALLAYGVATGLAPHHYEHLSSLVWPSIPLASAVVVFSLGIFVAGSNPTEKLNQLAGTMLFLLGFYVVMGVHRALDVEPIVSLRIDQLCYLAFALAPSVQPRVALAAVGLATPRWMRILDGGALLCSALALTPFMFRGYFVYEFGRVPASGPGLTLFSAIGAGGTVAGLAAAVGAKGASRSPRSSLVVAACFVGGALLVLSIPATRGVPFYSFGHLQLFPAALFAFAVLRFGALPLQEEVGRVSARFTLLALTVLPLVALLLFSLLPAAVPLRFRVFHIVLLLAPLFLMMLVLLFVLSRPIAERLEHEKARAERLLASVLPPYARHELAAHGRVAPRRCENVTLVLADFVGFAELARSLPPAELVRELAAHLARFDAIVERHGLERLKVGGDAYWAAGGLTPSSATAPVDACLAALALREEVERLNGEKRAAGRPVWPLRIGIHTGPLTAGVLEGPKLTFDVWGDAVDVVARVETTCAPGAIHLSETTRNAVESLFVTEARGRIEVKKRGRIATFFLVGLRPELAESAVRPNDLFARRYAERMGTAKAPPSSEPASPSLDDALGVTDTVPPSSPLARKRAP